MLKRVKKICLFFWCKTAEIIFILVPLLWGILLKKVFTWASIVPKVFSLLIRLEIVRASLTKTLNYPLLQKKTFGFQTEVFQKYVSIIGLTQSCGSPGLDLY